MGLNKRLIGAGATAGAGGLTPSENFKVVTFTGDGTSSKFIEVGFTPDFVWIKGRNASSEHKTIDSSRSAGCLLYTNLTNAEDCNSSHAVIETNGFNVKGNPNVNGREYVAWCWKANGGTTSSNSDGTVTSTVQANTAAGFSIVTATAPSSGVFTVGHGLNAEIDLYIIKNTSSTGGWQVYVRALGANKYIELNGDAAAGTSTNFWDNTNPTSSVFTMKAGSVITGTSNFVAYCFKSIDGFSKIGSYTGNGSSNIIETGFEPAFIMIKKTSGSGDWRVYDNKRGSSSARYPLYANLTNTEGGGLNEITFLSNGFQVGPGNNTNDSGSSYIYMAFAADPDTEAPTLADSFGIKAYTGTGAAGNSVTGLGFSPSLVWLKPRSFADNHNIADTVRGATKFVFPNLSSEEFTNSSAYLTSFDNDGFTLGTDNGINKVNEDFIAWAWKADDNEPTAFFNSAVTGVYKFEDNVNDVAGINNGASAVGLTYTSSGKFNKAVVSSGTNGEVSLSQIPPMTTAWTFSFWFYSTDLSGVDIRIILQTGTGFAIGTESSKIYIFTGGSNRGSGTSISANTWYHYVATYDGTSLRTYLDGSLAETITTLTGMSAGNLKLFDPPYAGWTHYAGRLDQLRVYSTGLSSTQITALYNETTSDNDTVEFPTGLPNGSVASIVSANANAGFSIVNWEQIPATGTTVPHGLSAAPNMIITKATNDTDNWYVYHSAMGTGKFMYLNLTNAQVSNAGGYSAVGASTFTSNLSNNSGIDMISYCFHDVAGYSKFGSYSGTGSSNTQSVNTGFQPDWVMIKDYSAGGSWWIEDSVRGSTKSLKANTSNSESTTNYVTEFTSTGFNVTGGLNDNSVNSQFIYMAFKIN